MKEQNIPVFVERDPDVIMSECKTKLEELLGRELQPAQVEQLMLQFIVYREVLLVNRFNAGMAQMLYQFSKAPVLDYIAGLVAVERLPAASAGCTVRFTLVVGHDYVLIPEGTRVATEDGIIYSTIEDITVPAYLNTADVGVLAETPGKAGNGYAAGAIKKILDPIAYVSTVANLDVTGGGSDDETDDQLRERIKLAPSQYSSAGSQASYMFYAKSANALITDVSVTSPVPGSVLVVPLTEADETPAQVIEDVYNACSPENVRPLTDTVIAAVPTRRGYSIRVNVVLFENSDAAAAKSNIEKILTAYAAEKRMKLGRDIVRSDIAQKSKIESVYDVTVEEPVANIIISEEEFSHCNNIVVNITGFNRG